MKMRKKDIFLIIICILFILSGCDMDKIRKTQREIHIVDNMLLMKYENTEYYVTRNILDEKDIPYENLGYLYKDEEGISYTDKITNAKGVIAAINGIDLKDNLLVGINENIYELKIYDDEIKVIDFLNIEDLFN